MNTPLQDAVLYQQCFLVQNPLLLTCLTGCESMAARLQVHRSGRHPLGHLQHPEVLRDHRHRGRHGGDQVRVTCHATYNVLFELKFIPINNIIFSQWVGCCDKASKLDICGT